MADAEAKVDISRVLNNTFGVIGRNPVVFLGLSFLIVGLPNALFQTAQGTWTTGSAGFNFSANYSAQGLEFILLMLLSVLLQATLIVATINDLAGKQFSFSDCLSKALHKLLPLIGLGILFSIGISIGFVLLVVPGVILYLMWIVSAPAMMSEDLGVIDSMKRSAELTSGSKRMIFVLMLVYVVLAFVLGLFIAFFGSISTIFLAVATIAVSTITGALQGAGIASIYVDLRTAKEGTDTSSLAEVFS
jgi:hypothetical protein